MKTLFSRNTTNECITGARNLPNIECDDLTYLSCAMETIAYRADDGEYFHTRRFCSTEATSTSGKLTF